MTFYRKYRPQNFNSVAGQEHIIKTISNQILKDKVAHAYLFSGPRGVGKTTTARLIAKAVNCRERDAKTPEPCDSCDSCISISQGRSIDVMEIDAASNTGVDNVRENIIENSQFQPTNSKYKIFIVDEVHMLSTSAFNALLKTLEEPPKHIIFILATTELQKIPETIISRCQRFQFKKIDYEILKEQLLTIAKKEKIKIDDIVIDSIIQKSEGCLRDAISLLDQIASSGEKNITKEKAELFLPVANYKDGIVFVKNIVDKNKTEALLKINEIVENGTDVIGFSNQILEILRTVLLTRNSQSSWDNLGILLDPQTEKQIKEIGSSLSDKKLIDLIDFLLKRKNEFSLSPIPQLPMEMFVLEACLDEKNIIKPENIPQPVKPMEPKIIRATEIQQKAEPPEPKQKTPDPQIAENPQTNASPENPVSMEKINKNWDQFVKEVEKTNPTLTLILKMATPEKIENNLLEISVPFGFHKDKLTDPLIMPKLKMVLGELSGAKIDLNVILKEAGNENRPTQKDDELENLAKMVGGEIL